MKNSQVKKHINTLLFFIVAVLITFACANNIDAKKELHRIIHVKQDGKADYRTINDAANVAKLGDTIIVHKGTYRETVVFPRGGNGESSRITDRKSVV